MESIRINGAERHQTIWVDTQGEDVWVNMHVPNGSCYMCVTPVEAKRMIKALETAIAKLERYEDREEARLDAMYDDRYGED